jgi:hypothetical protein
MALYGARLWGEVKNESDLRYDFLGKDSEVIAAGDILQVTSGVLNVGTQTIVGVAARAYTAAQMGSDNDTVYPAFIPVSPDSIWLMGTNSDLTDNETNGGTYYGVTGATGAQRVDVTTGVRTTTARTVEIIKVDPRGIGGSGANSGLREVLVRFVKSANYNVSTTT